MTRLEEITSFLGKDWTEMLQVLRRSLATDVAFLGAINEKLISNSGKLLRPMLSLLAARACNNGVCTSDSIRFAAAVELLHNATLLHDDVADDSPERRGVPTVYSRLGAAPAVLVGDFWLSRAVDTVLSGDRHEKVIKFFSKVLTDLSEGEMIQLEKASEADTDMDDYLRIIYCKTASLFEASLSTAAVSVDAGSLCCEALKDYGRALGMAFQIRDDILDYEGGQEIGKPRGADIREGKITLPLLGALEGYPREREIRDMIKNVNSDSSLCERIVGFVKERKGCEYAREALRKYVDEACSAIEDLPASREKDMLTALAEFTASRNV